MRARLAIFMVAPAAALVQRGLQPSQRATALTRMAIASKARREENAPTANTFVDASCIDCSTCRWMAPSIFKRVGQGSAVVRDPENDQEKLVAYRAMIACPTGSIRLEKPDPLVKAALADIPHRMEGMPNVYHLAYHSEKSYGATPWLLKREDGNIMVDSPRFSKRLADRIEEMGGVHTLFLTHQDDVADHAKWKERFPAMRRIMHKADVRAGTSSVELQLENASATGSYQGLATWDLAPGLTIIHTPGHTNGCVSLFAERGKGTGCDEGALFTGDHLAMSLRIGRLDGFAYVNRDGIKKQADSIAALADLDFTWLFPGHGSYWHFESAEDRASQVAHAAEVFGTA